MDATGTASPDATVATPSTRLNFDLIDQRAKDLGIETETALAELLDLNTSSLWRFRRGLLSPSLETVLRTADRLDLEVEDVIVRGGAQ